MKHIIPIAALAALAAIAWHVGGMMPVHTMTLFFGFLFGAFVGIPAMLIIATRAQTVRHDVHYHTHEERPRITVVTDRPALPMDTRSRLEVKQ